MSYLSCFMPFLYSLSTIHCPLLSSQHTTDSKYCQQLYRIVCTFLPQVLMRQWFAPPAFARAFPRPGGGIKTNRRRKSFACNGLGFHGAFLCEKSPVAGRGKKSPGTLQRCNRGSNVCRMD